MDRNDVLGTIGITLYGIGAWLINPAFFFITVGLLFLSAAILGAKKKGGDKK